VTAPFAPSRRRLLAGAVAAFGASVAPPLRAAPARRYRVMMIVWRGETDAELGFRDYFHERGMDVEFIVRDADSDVNRVAEFAREARETRPDLIYTWGTPATLAVVGEYDRVDPARHITDIPVVFNVVASPEQAKIVPTRAGSGRNVTGAVHIVPLSAQIAAMRAYRPFKRLAVIYNPAEPNSVINVRELESVAGREKWELEAEAVPLDDAGRPMRQALPELIARVAVGRPQFLYIGPDSFLGVHRMEVTRLALEHKIAVYSATESILVGTDALFGLVSRFHNLGRLVARQAESILVDGVPPGLIPIGTLSRFSYIINMPSARKLGLYPPMSVLDYAEVVR